MHVQHRKLAGFQESPSCHEATWILGCLKFMLTGHLSLLSSQRHPHGKLVGMPCASQVSGLVYRSPLSVCSEHSLFATAAIFYSELFSWSFFHVVFIAQNFTVSRQYLHTRAQWNKVVISWIYFTHPVTNLLFQVASHEDVPRLPNLTTCVLAK